MKYSRNEFLKLLGVGIPGAVALAGSSGFTFSRKIAPKDMPLGIASYTFRNFSLDETIEMAKRLGIQHIALKSMHLPLESSPEEIKKTARKVRDAGINLYGAGVIYMKTPEEVNQAFDYAKAAGLEMIIGVPNHELLSLVNEKVRASDIKLAIHNHGPGDDLYSSPNDVHERIKNLDKRIGFCIDIGHVKRIDQDPAAMIERYKDRLYDIHMKDVNKATAEGTPVEVGRGIIDIPKVLSTLQKINYQGHIAFEYEKDGEDPLPGLAESAGYVRGVLSML